MSLSNLDKDHQYSLFLSLNNNNVNTIDAIKSDHVNYARLEQIAAQINLLKNEAQQIIKNAEYQKGLQLIKKEFKLVSGTNYYLYKNKDKKYFSLISPEEWSSNKDTYIGKYYYDYDKQFKF